MYRYFLALRYLLSRPINLLGMAGVAVGVWAMILVVSIFSGFLQEVRLHVKSASSDLTVLRLPPATRFAEVEPLITGDANVVSCAPRLVAPFLLSAFGATHEVVPVIEPVQQPGAAIPFINVIGIDPGAELKTSGLAEWLEAVDDPDHRVADTGDPLRRRGELPPILLGERRLATEFIEVGATVKITSAQITSGTTGGGLEMVDAMCEVVGTFRTRHHAFDSSNALMAVSDLRRLLQASGGDGAAPIEHTITEIVVRCVDPALSAETGARLQAALDRHFSRNGNRPSDVLVLTWQRLNENLLSAVDHQRSLMKLVLFVIMVVAAFLMFATLSMMVTEKTQDVGVLAAMGATRGGVVQVFLTCGVAIVVTGTAVGVLAGCLSSLYLDGFNRWLRATFDVDLFPTHIYNLERVPYELDPLWILQVAGMALAVGVAVSALPAWRAARHDPVQSLRIE